MTPVEQRLRSALHDGATRLRVPESGPGEARRRARQRARRLHAFTATSVVAVLVVGVLALWGDAVGPRFTVIMDTGEDTDDASTAERAPTRVPEPLTFEWRDAEGLVGHTRHAFYGSDGAYYALSTAPGARFQDYPGGYVPQALYRSEDGLDWDAVPLGEEPWVADLGERAGLLYALSTAVGTNGGSGQVALSDDSGQTWQHADLPSAATPPEASVTLGDGYVTGRLAVGEDVLVAALRTTYRIDLELLLGAGEADHTFGTQTAEGLALFEAPEPDHEVSEGEPSTVTIELDPREPGVAEPADPPGVRHADQVESMTPARTITWEEMGLSGPEDLTVDELFVSRDGVEWDAVPSPFGGRAVSDLVATPHGFVAVLTSWSGDLQGSVDLMRSTDGVSWEPLGAGGALAEARTLQAFGVVEGGRMVAVPHSEDSALEVLVSDDGGHSWSVTDLAPLVSGGPRRHASIIQFDAGPLGVALGVVSYAAGDGPPEHHLLTSQDAATWSVTPLGDIVEDTAGSSLAWIGVGSDALAFGVTWLSEPDGTPARSRTYVGTPTR